MAKIVYGTISGRVSQADIQIVAKCPFCKEQHLATGWHISRSQRTLGQVVIEMLCGRVDKYVRVIYNGDSDLPTLPSGDTLGSPTRRKSRRASVLQQGAP